jgi:hypothetical protein
MVRRVVFVADMNEATVYSELRKKHARKRKRPSNSEGSEQNKPRKKRPKVEVVGTGSGPMISYPEMQMSSIPGSANDSPVMKKIRIKRVKKVKLQNQEDKLQIGVKPLGDEKFLDEARRCPGKYYITFTACLFFMVKSQLICLREHVRNL